MHTSHRAALVAGLVLCLAAGGVPQSQGTQLIVTKKATKLRTQKRALAPSVCDLVEGDKVTMQQKDGVWYSVTYKQSTGFIHGSDVTENKEVRLSGQGVREVYTASEQSAARKGFNPQVENEYRNQNPNLEPAFRQVDAILAKTIPDSELERFLGEGRLLKGGKQ
jgi:uncharacterized protein YgiM (DUF1202 family)